ncbi:rab-GTPase-TBC domain-containing protein [Thelephora terrestris]|uniref:Rab-GTPase-TBC domain-containing protein n=1 Tax=Thelephora terrestris TaxID=56493 RepID=A0A9P6L9M8_9AGAM|nr:rab-GTPase-TBC domain-containing protein [Thelephora terrestris]
MPHLDWDRLRRTSLNPGGFGNERVTIWPQVLNASTSTTPNSPEPLMNGETVANEKGESLSHRDERQIMLDTDRSFVHYPSGESDEVKEEMKTRLNELIVSIFRKRPTLNYYQGYHDIISVLFLTLPPEIQSASVEKLSIHRLRDSMGPGLEPLIGLLQLLKNLLRLIDPEYAQLLERNIPTPYYALSNLLTLFSHDMPTLALIQHTFDYLLVRPPVACVYVAAAIILSRKEEVTWLETVGEEGMLHSILSSLPILYEEGEEGDPQLPISDAEGTQVTKTEDTTAAVNEKLKVDALPNGEPTPKPEEPSVVELAVDAPPSTPPPVDVNEQIRSLTTDSLSIFSDVSRKLSTPSLDTSTVGSDRTALDDETLVVKPPAFTENDITLVDEPVTKVEAEESKLPPTSTSTPPSEPEPEVEDPWPDTPGQPARARMSLSSLLRQADDLFTRFPPSHPKLDLEKIMGPRSVVFTWTEPLSSLPPDDELEQYVKTPQLVVLPYVDPVEEALMKERQERELQMRKVARRGKLRKVIFARANVQKKTMFVGAVFALGIAMAVYGIRPLGDAGRWHHRNDLKKLLRYVGGLLLAGGDKFVGRLFGH